MFEGTKGYIGSREEQGGEAAAGYAECDAGLQYG